MDEKMVMKEEVRNTEPGRRCPYCGCDLGLNPFSICSGCGHVLQDRD